MGDSKVVKKNIKRKIIYFRKDVARKTLSF